MAHLHFIQLDDARAYGFLPQQGLINKAVKGLRTIGIRTVGLINCGEGQIVSKVLQADDLTIARPAPPVGP
jgi:hypothetical protein